MATYIRGQATGLEGILRRDTRSAVAPILSVSVGTAGASRNWRFREKDGCLYASIASVNWTVES